MKNITFSSQSTKHIGRVFFDGSKLWLTQSGSGCEFIFIGKKLTIVLGCDESSAAEEGTCNNPRAAVKVNGRFRIKKRIDNAEERFDIISSDTVTEARISIVKLSEAAFSLAYACAEADDEASFFPVEAHPKRIEFIGDSITCGYGVDDSNTQSDFAAEAENALKSYACIAAEMLGTEYSLFSYSGYGVISGWTESGARDTNGVITRFYEKWCHSYKHPDGNDIEEQQWDFSSMPSDIVVLNIGTNDNSYCTKNEGSFKELEDEYLGLLRKVRKYNPDAAIISTIGITPLSDELYESLHNAVERFKAECDTGIEEFRFTPHNGWLGYGSNWHPSEDTHYYAAEELAEFIGEKHLL